MNETQPDTENGSANGGIRLGYPGRPKGYRRFYFILFYLSVIIEVAAFAAYHGTVANERKSAYTIALLIIQVSPAILASSAFFGYSVTEAVKMIADMVMDWVRDRREKRIAKAVAKGVAKGVEKGLSQGRAQGRAQGLSQGRAQGRAQGEVMGLDRARAWNRRRMDAEARGMPFDEPFPSAEDIQDTDRADGG